MSTYTKVDICQILQWVSILIAVLTGVYAALNGSIEVGAGIIAAALSSSHVVTSRLPRCTVGDRRVHAKDDAQNSKPTRS